MKRLTRTKIVSAGFFLLLFLGMACLFQNRPNTASISEPNALQPSQSTDIGNPITFVDHVTYNHTYAADTDYYYRCPWSIGALGFTVWVQAESLVLDDFDLLFYNDSAYTELLAFSNESWNGLEWIVYHHYHGEYAYPMVHAQSGSSGDAFIQWQSNEPTITGSTGILNVTNCLDSYTAYFTSDTPIQIDLEVPEGCDFQLYVYYSLTPFSWGNTSQYKMKSETFSPGVDEMIPEFQPHTFVDYFILVTRYYGSGTYRLSITEVKSIPAFEFIYVFLSVCIGSLALAYLQRHNNKPLIT